MNIYTVYSFFPYRHIGVQKSVSKIITHYDVEIIHVLLIIDINYIAFIKFSSVTLYEYYNRTLTYTIN